MNIYFYSNIKIIMKKIRYFNSYWILAINKTMDYHVLYLMLSNSADWVAKGFFVVIYLRTVDRSYMYKQTLQSS